MWPPGSVKLAVRTPHGRFNGQAKDRSLQLWASEHHGLVGAAAGAGLLALAALARRRR